MAANACKLSAHIVDILGNVIGRDQPILRIEKAMEMVSMLGDDVFSNDDVVFFDPFCKAGELLLACSIHCCWAKAKRKPKLLDVDMVIKEIYHSNRYFGLAPDERHHRLSIRTFLGNEHSHNKTFNHIIRDGHYLSEEDGTLDKNKFEMGINSMIAHINSKTKNKKIIVVGNPPYQEEDGGAQRSAKPIYNLFVEQLIASNIIDEFILVIPARWFAGGKGLDNFREAMITSRQIKHIEHFGKSGDVFPTVDIDGGVCFLHWDSKYDGDKTFNSDGTNITLNLTNFDIIPDDPGSHSILNKVFKKWSGKYVSDIAWTGKPFGLRTYWFERNALFDSTNADAVPCLYRNRKVGYVNKKIIKKNVDKLGEWKVCIPNAYGGKKGDRRITLPPNQIFLLQSGWITTETYNVVGSFKAKKEADFFIKYLQSDFVRYLLGLRKITQHIPKERWAWVPLLTMDKLWTDDDLFNHFCFDSIERTHIRKKIIDWT